jgi:hypothetical protein
LGMDSLPVSLPDRLAQGPPVGQNGKTGVAWLPETNQGSG